MAEASDIGSLHTKETSASKSKVPREKEARRLDTGLAAVAAAMQEVGQEKSAAAAVGSKTNKSSINSSQYNFTMPKDMRGRGGWEWRCFVPAPDKKPLKKGAGRSDIYWVVNGSVGLKLRGGCNSSRFEIKSLCGLAPDLIGLECYTKEHVGEISFEAARQAMVDAGLSPVTQVGSWEEMFMVEIRKKRKWRTITTDDGSSVHVDFQKLEVALLVPSLSGSVKVAGRTYKRGETSQWRSYCCEGPLAHTKKNAPKVLAHVKHKEKDRADQVLSMGYPGFVVWLSQQLTREATSSKTFASVSTSSGEDVLLV